MKKSVVFTTTAATLGLATVLTLTAVVPSEAKVRHVSTTKSASAKARTSGASFRIKSASTTGSSSTTEAQRQFTTVNFTVNNVPSTITDAATAAKLLVVKVVPLASTATSAPATAPAPTFGAGNGGHHGRGGHGDGDGDGGKGGNGGWTPSGTTSSTPAPTTGSTTAPAAPDNDGDGPAAGTAPAGAPAFGGHGHGMQISNLTLTNGVLTGTIQIPGDEVANVQNWGIYLSIAADSTNGIAAQTGTPVMVTVTTAADLSASVTATTGDIVLNLPTA